MKISATVQFWDFTYYCCFSSGLGDIVPFISFAFYYKVTRETILDREFSRCEPLTEEGEVFVASYSHIGLSFNHRTFCQKFLKLLSFPCRIVLSIPR